MADSDSDLDENWDSYYNPQPDPPAEEVPPEDGAAAPAEDQVDYCAMVMDNADEILAEAEKEKALAEAPEEIDYCAMVMDNADEILAQAEEQKKAEEPEEIDYCAMAMDNADEILAEAEAKKKAEEPEEIDYCAMAMDNADEILAEAEAQKKAEEPEEIDYCAMAMDNADEILAEAEAQKKAEEPEEIDYCAMAMDNADEILAAKAEEVPRIEIEMDPETAALHEELHGADHSCDTIIKIVLPPDQDAGDGGPPDDIRESTPLKESGEVINFDAKSGLDPAEAYAEGSAAATFDEQPTAAEYIEEAAAEPPQMDYLEEPAESSKKKKKKKEKSVERDLEEELGEEPKEKKKKKKKKKADADDVDSAAPSEMGEEPNLDDLGDEPTDGHEKKKKKKKKKKHDKGAESKEPSQVRDVVAPEQAEIDFEEEEKKRRRKKLGALWKKPPTRVYFVNFQFGVNGYQCMLDYIDRRDALGSRYGNSLEVRLPTIEERALQQFRQPIQFYENSDVSRFISRGERIHRNIRQNDAAGIVSALNRTHTGWSMTKKWVQAVTSSASDNYRKSHKPNFYENEEDAYDSSILLKPDNYQSPALYRPQITSAYDDPIELSSRSRSLARVPASIRARSYDPTYGRESSYEPAYQETVLPRKEPAVQFLEAARRSLSRVPSEPRYYPRDTNSYSAIIETPIARRYDRAPSTMNDNIIQLTKDLAHSQAEHNAYMSDRRRKLDGMDTDIHDVITTMGARNARPYQSSHLPQRRQVDDIDKLQQHLESRQRLTNSLRRLDDEIGFMTENATSLRRKHVTERANYLSEGDDVALAKALILAQQNVASRNSSNYDHLDPDLSYQRRSKPVDYSLLELQSAQNRPKDYSNIMSDVQERVMSKASRLLNTTNEAQNINRRSKFINIYGHRHNTGDPVVYPSAPSRTELNIAHMANTFTNNGRMVRRFDVDDEYPEPVSNINTNDYNKYVLGQGRPYVPEVLSNSLRVRDANLRARARNTLLQ